MSAHQKMPRAKKKKLIIKLMIFFVALVVAVVALDWHIRPIITTMSSYQAKVYATKIINQAVSEELKNEGISYGNLVRITTNENGNVTSVQTDMMQINMLKTNIAAAVLADLDKMENQVIYLPIGTLFGGQIFSGRGPEVEFRIVPTGSLNNDIVNKFDSVGINQVRHQIMLKIEVEINAFVPGYSVQTIVNTDFCVAETVIVGMVPEAYTEIIGDNSSLPSKVFDYGAEKNPNNQNALK